MCEDFLNLPPYRAKRTPKPKVVTTPGKYDLKGLYYEARKLWFAKEYPQSFAQGGYYDSLMPKIATSNGMTMFIINFLNWSGHNADRTGTQGRMIKDKSGNFKRISAANRKGTSDVSATIKGRSVKLEIKAGKDTPSKEQLREQDRERAAGGCYEFIYCLDGFFDFYYSFLKTLT